MLVDRCHRNALRQQPVLHGIEAIQSRSIEGGAHEAPAVFRIGHAAVIGPAQGAEGGIPAGIARTRRPARRTMHEADPSPAMAYL